MSTRKSWLKSEYRMKMKTRHFSLSGLLAVAFGVAGCADYYTSYPGYGPYYGGYGGGYYSRPYYGGYPGSVTVAVGDRPYYVHGTGYYAGRTHYVWRPGHWSTRHGHQAWVHGHYIVR